MYDVLASFGVFVELLSHIKQKIKCSNYPRVFCTFLNSGSIVPKKGIGFGQGIPRDSQYPKCHV